MYIERLANSLAELCASDAESIIIAGTERIGRSLWFESNGGGSIPSSAIQTKIIRTLTQEEATKIMTEKNLSVADIAHRLGRVKFQPLVKYAKNLNKPEELGGQLLEHCTSLPKYFRPAMDESGDIYLD